MVRCIVSTEAPISARLTAASVAASLAKETTLARVDVMGTASQEEKEEDVTSDEAPDAKAFEMIKGTALASALRVSFTYAAQERPTTESGTLPGRALWSARGGFFAMST